MADGGQNIQCDRCGKTATMQDIHVLPDGWEQSMGDNFCDDCMTEIIKRLSKSTMRRKCND